VGQKHKYKYRTRECICHKNKTISAEEQFYDKEVPGWQDMKQSGEIGIVNYGSENKHKVKHLN
jgi:hypothetical protein